VSCYVAIVYSLFWDTFGVGGLFVVVFERKGAGRGLACNTERFLRITFGRFFYIDARDCHKS